MNKITMTTPMYTLELETDEPLTALECWRQYNLEKYGNIYMRRHSYISKNGQLVRGHKLIFHYAGEPVGDDFIVPVNNTEFFQVWGALDYDEPLPEEVNVYY